MAFVLAHLSDLHLPPLPALVAKDFLTKRLFGYLNWKRGRGAVHDAGVLQKLCAHLLAQQPDHIALTGDLTNLAMTPEFERMQAWLRAFAFAEKISLVPGNHDAYVKGALEDGLHYLADWLPRSQRSTDLFPYVHERGNIALIGLSSAVATPPLIAAGEIGEQQLHQLGGTLKRMGLEKKFRVVLVHHALQVRPHEKTKRLYDAEQLQNVLLECGAELVLHGHLHRPVYYELKARDRVIPVIGVPSASADPSLASHAAGYALYRIEEKDNGWQLSIARYTLNIQGAFEETHEASLLLPKYA